MSGSGSTATGAGGTGGSGGATPSGAPGPNGAAAATPVPDADLDALATVEGRTIRVGGLVTTLTTDGFRLDDGTAVGEVVLDGPARSMSGLIEPGDAINVIGRVVRREDDTFAVVVADPGTIVIGTDPGDGLKAAETSAVAAPRAPAGSGRPTARPRRSARRCTGRRRSGSR